MSNLKFPIVTFATSLLLISCSADDAPISADGGIDADANIIEPDSNIAIDLEAIGTWESQFGGLFTITEDTWNRSGIVQYNNDSNVVITQNPSDDAFNPDKFNREVWTEIEDGAFYICTVAFGLETADDAINSIETADASDPANSGCGGFSWTRLFTPIEVYGTWATNFATTEEIVTASWSGSSIVEFDNIENVAITQNPEDSAFDPGKFNKLVWTEIDNNKFYYCTIDFGKDTAEDARNTTNVADASDPDNSGCGGFSWTKVVPAIDVHGVWDTNFSTTEVIDSFSWAGSTIVKYDNDTNFSVTQNPEDAAFDPGKFNKLVWTKISNNSLYYCTIDFGQDTAELAENTSNVADVSDPENSGCGGFSWTKLTPAAL